MQCNTWLDRLNFVQLTITNNNKKKLKSPNELTRWDFEVRISHAVFNSTSHSFAALTREISSWTLEDKIHIHARSCNILYLSIPCQSKVGTSFANIVFIINQTEFTPSENFLNHIVIHRLLVLAWLWFLVYLCLPFYF